MREVCELCPLPSIERRYEGLAGEIEPVALVLVATGAYIVQYQEEMPIALVGAPAIENLMYGLINKAVRGLVLDQFGEDAWRRIRQAAQVDDDDFLAMEGYDDEVTYALVGAASSELGLEPEAVLRAFGEYWVDYVADENYGHLMQSAGQSFPEFLANLDQMHARVKLTFPNLQPPSFSVTDQTEDSLRLHYYSGREGLGPLVVGLLHGLGRRFDTDVDVEAGREGTGPDEHDVFQVHFKPAVNHA